MIKAIKLSAIFFMLVVLLVPTAFASAADSGPRISHVCVETGSTNTIALVVWPGAPSGVEGSKGQLTVTWSGGTFPVDLTYYRTDGTAAKWIGVVVLPAGVSGTLTITAGWVVDKSNTIQNLPFTFVYGKQCTPTAVTLNSLSARSVSTTPLVLAAASVLVALGLIVVKRF